MKKKYLLILPCLLAWLFVRAQDGDIPPAQFFDPERNPVAMRSDSGVVDLIVSEYVLAKSIKARMGQNFLVQKISKSRWNNGQYYLMIEGKYTGTPLQKLAYGIRLIPDLQGKFFYANAMTDKTCGVEDCDNCYFDQNGDCAGCCPNNPNAISAPLIKVLSTIDP